MDLRVKRRLLCRVATAFFLQILKTFCYDVTVLTLQADRIPSNNSWAYFKNSSSIPDMRALTICSYLKIIKARRSYDTFISYAVPTEDNCLYVGFNFPNAYLTIYQGQDVIAVSKFPVHHFQWNRFCYSQDLERKIVQIWWNDDFQEIDGSGIKLIEGSGAFYLGQDQDVFRGDFSSDQSFNALIGNFMFFNFSITPEDAEKFVGCNGTPSATPLLDFDDMLHKWDLNGSVDIALMQSEEICSEDRIFYIMHPERRSFPKTVDLCHNIHSEIALPRNKADNDKILSILMRYIDVCRDASGILAWLAAIKDKHTKTYKNYYTSIPLAYSNFGTTVNIENTFCSSMEASQLRPGNWVQFRCIEEPLCGLCEFQNITKVQVRGLCTSSLLDFTYFIYEYKNRKSLYSGFYGSDLYWEDDTWKLKYLAQNGTNATMTMNSASDYPLGKHLWTMQGDKCHNDLQVDLPLVFTTCTSTEFTCDDGSCIHINNRCDLLLDCKDQSDEADCNTILPPASYIKSLSPPDIDGTALNVTIDFTVTAIRSFSLNDLTLSYDIILFLRWRDSRLMYKNIKNDTDENEVPPANVELIWVPEFFFEDDSGSKVSVVDHGSQTYINKEHESIPDDISRLKEDRLFPGSENSIFQYRVLTVSFLCLFDLSAYPFDIQTCGLNLRSTQKEKNVHLLVGKVEFMGEKRLLEYQMDNILSKPKNVNGYTGIAFIMTFFNLYKYYIFGTYVPTTLIVCITYMTFFFTIEDFNDRIMVSLTAMMVLAALFLQTSQGVARTAYMKLIDIWFIACMIFNFFIIVVLVGINYVKENIPTANFWKIAPNTYTASTLNKKYPMSNIMKQAVWRSPERLNSVFIILFPLLFILCSLGYISMIFISHEGVNFFKY